MGRDRVEKAITQILDSICDGVFKEESPLPAEAELARFLDVSRTTMREAIRSLAVGGVLKVVHGTGTYVQPYRLWHDPRFITHVALRRSDHHDIEQEVLELRRIIEVEAARLAAQRCTQEQLESLAQYKADYERAHAEDDINGAVDADLAFHGTILEATGNIYIAAGRQPPIPRFAVWSSPSTSMSWRPSRPRTLNEPPRPCARTWRRASSRRRRTKGPIRPEVLSCQHTQRPRLCRVRAARLRQW